MSDAGLDGEAEDQEDHEAAASHGHKRPTRRGEGVSSRDFGPPLSGTVCTTRRGLCLPRCSGLCAAFEGFRLARPLGGEAGSRSMPTEPPCPWHVLGGQWLTQGPPQAGVMSILPYPCRGRFFRAQVSRPFSRFRFFRASSGRDARDARRRLPSGAPYWTVSGRSVRISAPESCSSRSSRCGPVHLQVRCRLPTRTGKTRAQTREPSTQDVLALLGVATSRAREHWRGH